MNKTIAVNLSGFVFNIEEQAYERLKQYLDKIRNNFGNEEERDEIMDDIELRIAELFQEKIGPNKEVIIQDDINEVMDILGHPEDFLTDENEEYASSSAESNTQETETTFRKRLFRDPDNATLGGVCSGLAHYFDVDVSVIRIFFVLLFVLFGTGVLLYIILLIVVPEAKTTSDKIEMKGRSVNVESIKEHVSNIKQNLSDTAKKSQFRDNLKDTVDRGIKAGHSFFQVISKVIGVAFTVGGIMAFVFLILLLFGDTGILPFIGEDRIANIPTLIEIIYPGEQPSFLIFVSLLFVVFIPIISIIITGFRVLFMYKRNIKPIAWGLAITWIIAVSVLFFFSIELGSDFKSEKEVAFAVHVEDEEADNLIVDVMKDDQFSDHIDPYDLWSASELIKTDEEFIYLGWSELDVETTVDTGAFRVNLIKESRGASVRESIEKIENIQCPIISKGNTILISPYLKIPKKDKLRGQHVTLEIIIPKDKSVTFGSNIRRIWRQAYWQNEQWIIYEPGVTWYNSNGILRKSGTNFNDTESE